MYPMRPTRATPPTRIRINAHGTPGVGKTSGGAGGRGVCFLAATIESSSSVTTRGWPTERLDASRLRRFDRQRAVRDVDPHGVALVELAGEELDRERVLELPLEQPPKRPRAERGIVALAGEQVVRPVGELEGEFALGEPCRESAHLDVDDLPKVLARERLEHDDLIDPIDELRPEVPADILEDRVTTFVRSERRVLEDGRSEVRGHDHDRVAEIDRPSVPVRQPPIV